MAETQEDPPLLRDLERVRSGAPSAEPADRLLESWLSPPWYTVMVSTLGWMLQVFTVFGSFFWLVSDYESFTPKCYEYNDRGDGFQRFACLVTGYCFWTLPIFSAILAVITSWRHLYKSHLFYECLSHKVMMFFEDRYGLATPVSWLLVVYATLACSVFLFLVDQWHIFKMLQGMVIYFGPLFSFFYVFFSLWQVEESLIPLPRFYADDPALAERVLKDAVIAPEVVLRAAFAQVEDALEARRYDQPLTSAEYFAILAEAVRAEQKLGQRVAQDASPQAPQYGSLFGLYTKPSAIVVSKPEVKSWSYHMFSFFPYRVLHCRHFDDERSASFRFWARLHTAVSIVAILCLFEVYVATGIDFFKEQRVM